jgi:hypothetical protein
MCSKYQEGIKMRYILGGVATGIAVLTATAVSMAAPEPSTSAAQEPRPASSVYTPVMSDLMNAYIQPRHIKLWLAGKSQNWALADYENHNIGGALARMAKAIPDYHGAATPDLIAAFATPQIAAVSAAIKSKNEAAFVEAYGALTTGCSGCHQATEHDMVVMKVPDSAAFPDQSFTTPAP